jgi:hypothetical protein
MAALPPMMLDGSTPKNGKRRKSLEKWVGRTDESGVKVGVEREVRIADVVRGYPM